MKWREAQVLIPDFHCSAYELSDLPALLKTYHKKWLRSLDTIWQSFRENLITYVRIETLKWCHSVRSEALLNELVYCVTIPFTIIE